VKAVLMHSIIKYSFFFMIGVKAMGLKSVFKRRWIVAVGSSIATYLPIIAGIIEPMIWPLLVVSPLLYHLLYWWWSPIEQHFFPQWFFITSYISETYWVNQLAPIVIGVGVVILVMGMAQIMRAKARKTGLVTTGLYRYVRHPQHLGIAIMSFGLLMLNRYGIRIGDVIAWTLVVFVYVFLADSEEATLERKFGESYLGYKRRVPFMIPFLPSTYGRISKLLPNHGWGRRLALIGVYMVVLAVTIWLLAQVPSFHTR